MMVSLGVYVLGATVTAERQALEAHLPACPACRAELTRLAPLPGLLAGIPESMRDTARSPGGQARSLGRQARRPGRAVRDGGTRLRRAAGAAACLAAAAVTAGFWLSSGSGGPPVADLTL